MLSRLRVMVAEDHPLMREFIAQMLSEHCMIAGTVERGDVVLAAVGEWQPDGLVLDVSMPGRSGLQLLPELRASYPQLGIVILTNHGNGRTLSPVIQG